MNRNINWITLVPTLTGAAKLIFQAVGVDIPDQNLNEIANGIAALATVIGIIMSHRKQGGASNAQRQGDSGAAI